MRRTNTLTFFFNEHEILNVKHISSAIKLCVKGNIADPNIIESLIDRLTRVLI